ncbi:MAG TPA: methyltransferase domain-containing protein [Rhizomicrobium sp.]|jgi:protein-L-isoaspartate(D-aspartate) O-methyltransferase
MTEAELAIVRRAYAMQILAQANVSNAALEDAFSQVRREDYLGPGPWQMVRWPGGYIPTPSADPVYLYCNTLFGIVPERKLNNGEPAAHAMWIASVAPERGEHAVHVGAGVGYFSALFAHMVGETGRVTAIEFDEELAARARANLASSANATVLHGDGTALPFEPADVIYVNAGAARPMDHWLDRLKEGGRLLVPLTTATNFQMPNPNRPTGGYFRITRQGDAYLAKWISYVAVFPCEGARDPESEAALAKAFETPRWQEVTRLYRTGNLPEEQCWLRAPGWSLAYH